MKTPYLAQQPIDDFGFRFTELLYNASLAATTDTTFNVPLVASRYKAIIKCHGAGAVWVALNATAAVPAGATFAQTASELLTAEQPLCREVVKGDILHFITTTANTEVSIALYTVDQNN